MALLLLLLTAPAWPQENSKVGQDASEIKVTDWINRPEMTDIAAHRGEVLLLEFWATW